MAPQRNMIPLESDASSSTQNSNAFRLVCYNILSVHSESHPKLDKIPTDFKIWVNRWPKLLQEIDSYQPDVICLQEVARVHLPVIRSAFESRGFSCHFKLKSNYQRDTDGCATLFKMEKFTLLQEYNVAFQDLVQKTVAALPVSVQAKAKSRLSKDNIAIVSVLGCVGEGTPSVAIVNTHISANNDFPDRKLWQVSELINGIRKMGNSMPIIICGDMNSYPNSNPISLILGKELDYTREDFVMDRVGILQHIQLNHTLHLKSVYPWRTQKLRQLVYGPVLYDYIFYQGLSVVAYLDEREAIAARDRGRIPSEDWPSDHFALAADFCFLDQPSPTPLPPFLW